MQFITTGNRIAVENFEIGYFYTIYMLNGEYFQACCTGIGSDFVMFSRDEPDLLFSLTMQSAEDISRIELYGGGSGTNDYNDLGNKPQINGITLIGNKSLSDLGIQETISDLDTIRSGAAAGATAVQPADLATALATKQDTISDLNTIRSGAAAEATAVQPADLATALATKQDTISDLNTIRSGAAAGATAVQPADLATALATKQDTLSSGQLAAANSGIDSTKVAQIETNKNNISLIKHAANTSIYIQETEPTTPVTGDYWLSSSNGVKTYSVNEISFDISKDLKSAFLYKTGDNMCIYNTTESTSRTLVIPCSANAQYIVSVNSKTLRCAIYSTIPTNNSVSTTYAIDNLSEYSEHSVTVQSPSGGAYIALNCYLSNVEAADSKTIDDIYSTLTIIEKKWS